MRWTSAPTSSLRRGLKPAATAEDAQRCRSCPRSSTSPGLRRCSLQAASATAEGWLRRWCSEPPEPCIGTRFEATPEALITAAAAKAIVAARAEDTVQGRALDVVRDSPWPARYPARTLRNRITDTWQAREADMDDATKAAYRDGVSRGDLDYLPIWAGEAVDLISGYESAAALVGRIAREAELAIATRGRPR